MNQSEFVSFAMPQEEITFYAKIQGAGGAAPTRAPTTFSSTSSIGFMHASNNFVSITATDITRSGAGVYTMKLRDSVPVMLSVQADVWGPAATAKTVVIQDYNPSTRVLSFTTLLESNTTATDLAVGEFVVFTFKGQKNIPVY